MNLLNLKELAEEIAIPVRHLRYLLEQIEWHIPKATVWAFGSRVKWSHRPESDLDLAVNCDKETARKALPKLSYALDESDLPFKVQIADFNRLPPNMQANIKKNYLVLYQPHGKILPSGWKETTLEEVAEFSNGRTSPERFDSGEYEVFGSNGVIGLSDETNSDANTIIIGRVGSYCGSLYFSKNKCWVTDNAIKASAKENSDPFYLYYLLITQQLNSKAAGSGQPLINQEILNSIDVLTPPLPEQRAIAAILSSFDDKIELLRRQNKTLEAIAQTTFKEWFVKFNVPVEFKVNSEKLIVNSSRENTKSEKLKVNTKTGLPEGWRMGKLGDVIEIYGGGTPKTNLSEYWNGVIPWFSVVDVPSEGNIFVIKCEKHITQKGLENSSTRMLPVNTTIITARGTVGKLALVGVPMAMNQSCYGIYPKDSKSFFYIYLMIKDSLTMLKQQVHGAVFDTITRDTLNNISVNIPTNKIIELFEDTITPCFHKVLQNNFQIQTLSKLRDSLLPKLMKGETRVKDTEPFIKEKIK